MPSKKNKNDIGSSSTENNIITPDNTRSEKKSYDSSAGALALSPQSLASRDFYLQSSLSPNSLAAINSMFSPTNNPNAQLSPMQAITPLGRPNITHSGANRTETMEKERKVLRLFKNNDDNHRGNGPMNGGRKSPTWNQERGEDIVLREDAPAYDKFDTIDKTGVDDGEEIVYECGHSGTDTEGCPSCKKQIFLKRFDTEEQINKGRLELISYKAYSDLPITKSSDNASDVDSLAKDKFNLNKETICGIRGKCWLCHLEICRKSPIFDDPVTNSIL